MGVRPARLRACALATALVAALAPAPRATAQDAVEDAERRDDFAFGGPIELQDTFLPAQTRPQPFAESAAPMPAGAVALRVVGDWTNHFADTDTYLFDGESVTTTWRLRVAPWNGVELGVDLPWTARFDGTLDPFIENVEDALDARVRERFQRPRDSWDAIVVREDGSRRMRLRETDRVGDVVLHAKLGLARADRHAFDAAIAASLGLPSGAASFGGEGVSPGLALHLQKPFETLNLFAGAGLQHYTDATEQSLRLAPFRWMTYAGAEWRPWRSWLGLVFQYQVYGRLARTNDPLDDPAHYYAVGLRLHLPARVTLEATMIENLGLIENRNSSDVAFHFGVGWQFQLPGLGANAQP